MTSSMRGSARAASLAVMIVLLCVGQSATGFGLGAQETEGPQGPGTARSWQRTTGDFLEFELRPSYTVSYHNEFPFWTNKWGMRDREYSIAQPPHTYRIALLGSSVEMGAGVPVEKDYEWLVEQRLNQAGSVAPKRHYEILNFAVGAYGILQQVFVAEHKVLPFSPDLILLTIHSVESRTTMRHLMGLIKRGVAIPYPYLQEKLRDAGVRAGMGEPELRRRLAPVLRDVESWGYKRIAELGREHGIPVIAVVVPRADAEFLSMKEGPVLADQARIAADAGMPVLSLEDAFQGQPRGAVRLPAPNQHPNALGHALLANRLYNLLLANNARLLKSTASPR